MDTKGSGRAWGAGAWVLMAAAVFAGWLGLASLIYGETPCAFLRAESGWYELVSNTIPEKRADFVHKTLTRSYNGHYTPVALLAEYQATRWIGPVEGFWRWRQRVALAGVAAALFGLVCAAARIHRIRWIYAAPAALAITSVLVFQPLMRELVSWPFMVMQLGWMVLSLLAVTSLVLFVGEPARTRWLWGAVLFGYGSMHLLGLGVVTALAVWAILALLLAGIRGSVLPRFQAVAGRIAVALAVLTVLTLAHASCMALLLNPARSMPAAVTQPFSIGGELGFIASFGITVLRGIVEPGIDAAGPQHFVTALAPCGLLILLAACAIAFRTTQRASRDATPDRLSTAVLHWFTLVSFFGLVALMLARRMHDPGGSNIAGFLTAPRYLVPAAFALAPSLTAILIPMLDRAKLFGAAMLIIIALEPAITQRYFVRPVLAEIHPRSTIDHGKAWAAIVAMANESKAANLPIPNAPLGPLLQEFHTWDLKLFEPVLRPAMNLPESEPPLSFASWETARAPQSPYARAVPSLQKTAKLLEAPQRRNK